MNEYTTVLLNDTEDCPIEPYSDHRYLIEEYHLNNVNDLNVRQLNLLND